MSKMTDTFKFADGGEVVMRPLSVEGEIQVDELFREARRPHERIKRALVSVRGEAVTAENWDQVYSRLTPIERDLVAHAFVAMNRPDRDEIATFLGTRSTSVIDCG